MYTLAASEVVAIKRPLKSNKFCHVLQRHTTVLNDVFYSGLGGQLMSKVVYFVAGLKVNILTSSSLSDFQLGTFTPSYPHPENFLPYFKIGYPPPWVYAHF